MIVLGLQGLCELWPAPQISAVENAFRAPSALLRRKCPMLGRIERYGAAAFVFARAATPTQLLWLLPLIAIECVVWNQDIGGNSHSAIAQR